MYKIKLRYYSFKIMGYKESNKEPNKKEVTCCITLDENDPYIKEKDSFEKYWLAFHKMIADVAPKFDIIQSIEFNGTYASSDVILERGDTL